MKSIGRLISIILVASVLFQVPAAAFDRIRYNGGTLVTQVDPEDWGNRLSVSSDEIRLDLRDGQSVTIDPRSVTSLSYGQEAHRRVGTMVTLGILLAPLALVGLVHKTRLHFIGVEYTTSDGKNAGLLIQADKDTYRGVLAALRAATGAPVAIAEEDQKYIPGGARMAGAPPAYGSPAPAAGSATAPPAPEATNTQSPATVSPYPVAPVAGLPTASQASPCEDQQYQQLRHMPVGTLSDREYEYFSRKDRECFEYTLVQAKGHEETKQPALIAPRPTLAGTPPAPAVHVSPPLSWDSQAANHRRTSFSINGGFAPPTGSLTESHDVGPALGFGLSYQVSDVLSLDMVSLSYERFPVDESEIRNALGGVPVSISGGSVSATTLLSGVRIQVPSQSAWPYFAFGGGLFHGSRSEMELMGTGGSVVFPGVTENALAITLGGGVEGRVSDATSAYTELRVNIAFTEGESTTYVPMRAGIRSRF